MDYEALADRVLAGGTLTREEALAVLQTQDAELPTLLGATRRVRERWHGRRVKVCVLLNARSGLCPEDCGYCSQSSVSTAPIQKYRLLPVETMVAGARRAVEAGAKRYCLVTSGRGPSDRDVEHLGQAVRAIKQEFPDLEICCSLGLTELSQAQALKAAGVGWINHNLNTGERFYPEICSTHTYQDRVRTIQNIKQAGLSTCSGGIIGMGERDEDLVDLAFAVRALDIDSIPINFLHPIDGTPLAGRRELTTERCLKALCLVRLLNPTKEIRAAGGRELNLGEHQAKALCAANSIFVEGYLTTPGQAAEEADRMIREMGFEVEPSGVDSHNAIDIAVTGDEAAASDKIYG